MMFWQKRKEIFGKLVIHWLFFAFVLMANALNYKIADSFIIFSTSETAHKIFMVAYFIATYIGFWLFAAALPVLTSTVFVILYPKRWFVVGFTAIIATFIQIYLNIDIYCYNQYRFHFVGVMMRMLFTPDFKRNFGLGEYEIYTIGLFFIGIFFINLVLSWWCFIKLEFSSRAKKIIFRTLIISFIFSLYFSLLVISNIASVNFVNFRVYKETVRSIPYYDRFLSLFIKKANTDTLQRVGDGFIIQPGQSYFPLHYPLNPLTFSPVKTYPNVLIILVDTWRFNTLTQSIMPNTYNFSKNSIVFSNHFSGGNSTRAGVFSLFYGLPSTYWTAMKKEKTAPVLISELMKRNYQLGIFVSAGLTIPAFDKTVFVDVPHLQIKTPGDNPQIRDQNITKEFSQFLQNRDTQKPFFGFLFYDSAHSFCSVPDLSQPFKGAITHCERQFDPVKNIHGYYIRYLNALHFVDTQINEDINMLKKQGLLKNTMIIITGDHGEEFNDTGRGIVGHASDYTRFQVQTPFIYYDPSKKPGVKAYLTSHYDVVPHILKNALGCNNSPTDYSLGIGLFNPSPRPYLIVCSYTDFAIVQPNRITRIYSAGDYTINNPNGVMIPNAQLDIPTMVQAMNDLKRFYKK